MTWVKLGRIFSSSGHYEWMHSHAMIPIAKHLIDDTFRIFFSSRDTKNRGHGSFLDIDIKNPHQILQLSSISVLPPGDLGCFDDSGALPNCIISLGKDDYLYYTGINLGKTVKIRNSIGLAKWDEQRSIFKKVYRGPIIDRTRDFPHFVATPHVIFDEGRFKCWFTACQRWEESSEGDAKHFYNIEYCESMDGFNWNRTGETAIDFRDDFEYALGVPRVVKCRNGLFHMWFCGRSTEFVETYRIYKAISNDGRSWKRFSEVELDVSKVGWDSQMVCYPFVFDHGDDLYMLYNGNYYGKDGFGLAVKKGGALGC